MSKHFLCTWFLRRRQNQKNILLFICFGNRIFYLKQMILIRLTDCTHVHEWFLSQYFRDFLIIMRMIYFILFIFLEVAFKIVLKIWAHTFEWWFWLWNPKTNFKRFLCDDNFASLLTAEMFDKYLKYQIIYRIYWQITVTLVF